MLVYELLKFLLHAQTEWQEMEDARMSLAKEATTDEQGMSIFAFGILGSDAAGGNPESSQAVAIIGLDSISG